MLNIKVNPEKVRASGEDLAWPGGNEQERRS